MSCHPILRNLGARIAREHTAKHVCSVAQQSMTSVLAGLKPQHNVEIRTKRLHLRAVQPDDIAALHAMRINPLVMQFMYVRPAAYSTIGIPNGPRRLSSRY